MTYTIEHDREKYIVRVGYSTGPAKYQAAYFYRSERNAVKRIARFLRDNIPAFDRDVKI